MEEAFLSPGRYTQLDYWCKDVLFFDTSGASLEEQREDLESHEEKMVEGESLRSYMKWVSHFYQRIDSLNISGHSKRVADQFPVCKHNIRLDDGFVSFTYLFEKRDALRNIYKGGVLHNGQDITTIKQKTQEQLIKSETWDALVDKILNSPFDVKCIVYPDFSSNINFHYTSSPFSIRGEFRQERVRELINKEPVWLRRFIYGGTAGIQFPRVNAELYYEIDQKDKSADHTAALLAVFRPYRTKNQNFSIDFGFDLTARNKDISNLTGGLRINHVSQSGRKSVFVVQRTFFDHIQLSYTTELHHARKREPTEQVNFWGKDLSKYIPTNFDLTASTQFRYLNTDGSSEMTFGLEYRQKSIRDDDMFVVKAKYDTERGGAVMFSKRWYQGWADALKLDTSVLVSNSVPFSHYHQNYWSVIRDLRFGLGVNFEY